jgi:hypothetical protein
MPINATKQRTLFQSKNGACKRLISEALSDFLRFEDAYRFDSISRQHLAMVRNRWSSAPVGHVNDRPTRCPHKDAADYCADYGARDAALPE